MTASPDPRDVALGLAVGWCAARVERGPGGAVAGTAAVRAALVGGPLRRAARDLAHEGSLVRERARVRLETTVDELLASSELERAADRLLAGR